MTDHLERIYRHLTLIRDLVWGMEQDILETLPQIRQLSRTDEFNLNAGALLKYRQINFLLNCLNRLEIRGRDSAGIQIVFTTKEESVFQQLQNTLTIKNLYDDFVRRTAINDLVNYSITVASPQNTETTGRPPVMTFAFTYKTASVIGKLGQNVGDLAQYIQNDAILREFAQTEMDCESNLCHTRWASVGSISVENCHPVNNAGMNHDTAGMDRERNFPFYGNGDWAVNAALNGDIDNYHGLRSTWESGGKRIAPEITTDTKIIPLQIETYLAQGCDLTTSFRLALNDFEGSHAIAMTSDLEPGKVFLALRGSGQALYVGLCEEQYLFSSELYGLVERTPFFIPVNGEMPADPNHQETIGQFFILDNNGPGGVDGITAFFYDGTPLKLTPEHIQRAEITTRDINRGDFSHYFLKEIFESPRSVHQTLLGKYRIAANPSGDMGVAFNLGREILPEKIKNDLLQHRIRRIILIGHGTAAVAGHAISDAMIRYLWDTNITIETKVASELSGFFLSRDLSDTLLIPISQSGTTTDTNRAVAMSKERGAAVIAIVNRRQSDITAKADGVFYTSDGRDIEMSVASTKAFYSQIVAGHVLGLAFAWLLKSMPEGEIADELTALEEAPLLMNRVLSKKEEIQKAAQEISRHKTYWAVVGSGPNKAAADEIRIKLSELCYKTISSDIVENKKHIDLSAEPLIIVCSAGNPEAVIGDIVKDVAIFKAHKAGVIVFCDEGEERFDNMADAVIKVPRKEQPLPVILNTIAGHLFGFYAARCIDEDALFLRAFRNKLNKQMSLQDKEFMPLYARIGDRRLHRIVREFSPLFNARRNQGDFRAVNNKTIADIVLLLKYCAGFLKMEDGYADDFGAGSFPVDLLDVSLGIAIDELSRPIDAIRHQAKTVTVGTSRKEQPLSGVLFDLLKQLSFTEQSLSTKSMMTINHIQPAIAD
ncbi:MAG: SIS domain-containing protein, partial [Treponema sp.]|nr:SIS domain-containing protein [Treponema sp.]